MIGNDLSNKCAEGLLIRIEDTIVTYKEETLKDTICNFIFGAENRAEINQDGVTLLELLFKKTDFNVTLVVSHSYMIEPLQKLLKGIPYVGSIKEMDLMSIYTFMHYRRYALYVDNNIERRQKVGGEDICINVDKCFKYIRRT
jgi:hypothetical protein